MEYRATNGQITQRVIEPLTCSGGFLVAFCHLRHAQRTFRLDRIVSTQLLDV
ncbi:MAG: WYL domain-containing protein [Anaerolineae bacterium]